MKNKIAASDDLMVCAYSFREVGGNQSFFCIVSCCFWETSRSFKRLTLIVTTTMSLLNDHQRDMIFTFGLKCTRDTIHLDEPRNSGDSWMYPYQRIPMGNPALYSGYLWVSYPQESLENTINTVRIHVR